MLAAALSSTCTPPSPLLQQLLPTIEQPGRKCITVLYLWAAFSCCTYQHLAVAGCRAQ